MASPPPFVINVLFLATEADPFIKIGGLGDYAGSLPLALRHLSTKSLENHYLDIRLAIPFHSAIQENNWQIKFLTYLPVKTNGKYRKAKVYLTEIENIPVYLIGENNRGKRSTPIYSSNVTADGRKYAFFSFACLELLKYLNWPAQILHANDWHTSFAILKLDQLKSLDPFFSKMVSLITIHNLGYMGGGNEKIIREFNLSEIYEPTLPQWAFSQPLPMALTKTNLITTVSPNYAKEICTPEFGYGLETFLKMKNKSIRGILNGINEQKWDPQKDHCIYANFSVSNLEIRIKNKINLQKSLDLIEAPDIPLLTMISRIEVQKGVDLLLEALVKIEKIPWQLVILGTGNKDLERQCSGFEKKLPHCVRAIFRFDDHLARKLYSSADMLMIPSRYEPCGTTQMIAMRYGCIPLAHSVGGLKDSIINGESGFLFEDFTTASLIKVIKHAIHIYTTQPNEWNKIQKKAMRTNFSWKKSALIYAQQYLKLAKINI
jgi:starch synthase